jgi:hypothetical protein
LKQRLREPWYGRWSKPRQHAEEPKIHAKVEHEVELLAMAIAMFVQMLVQRPLPAGVTGIGGLGLPGRDADRRKRAEGTKRWKRSKLRDSDCR